MAVPRMTEPYAMESIHVVMVQFVGILDQDYVRTDPNATQLSYVKIHSRLMHNAHYVVWKLDCLHVLKTLIPASIREILRGSPG